MKGLSTFARAALLLVGFSALVWAQGTAQIGGVVQDSSGAAVPGADVKATQTDTAVSRTVSSGPNGEYVLNSLETGPYRLEVSKQGFATYVQTGIVLAVADSSNIPVSLKIGAVNEQVQVEANAALVETQNTGVSQVIENTRILELPLNGRNPADLIQLAGAAVNYGPANASSRSMQGVLGGEGYSIAGGQPSGTTFLLDGALHTNAYDNLNMPLPFPDALQEFKIETSALEANTGLHGGGTMTAVTKSGTNAYHGDAFEFLRNTDLDATNPFAAKGPDGKRLGDGLKRNQFGGTVGGPVKKNKLFFFGAYEGTTTRQLPASNISYVPNAAMLRGDFTTFASAACNSGKALTLTAPFVNDIAPISALNPQALKIASSLPATSDPCGQITYQSAIHQNEYQLLGKGDYHLNDHNSVFARYIATSEVQTPPFSIIPNILVTNTGGRNNLTQSAAIGDTHLFGSNKVNSFHLSMNRSAIHRTDKGFYDAQTEGINSFSSIPDYFQMTVSGGGGGFAIGSGIESESTFHTDTYEVGDDFSIVKGSHQFSFGARIAHWISSSDANVRSTGVFSFTGGGPPSTGSGMADFLTGKLALIDDALPNTLFMGQWSSGFYAQDRWKLKPNLTLNIGVRYEPWLPQSINNGDIYTFSFARFNAGTVSQTYPAAPPGLYYPGDPGFLGKSGTNNHLMDFEPRIGIAWDPFKDGKMSVRASYGLFYDFPNGQFYLNSTIAPPAGDEIRVNFPPGGLTNPWQGYPGGDPFPGLATSPSSFPLGAPYLPVQPNTPATEMHSWNFAVQRQIGSSWLVSISYVGNETEHLWVSTQSNPAVYIPGNCIAGQYGLTAPGPCSSLANVQSRRVLTLANPAVGRFYGYVDNYDPGATQSYNGAIFSIQHRLSHGFTIIANDTWSHCIAIAGSNEFSTQNVGVGYANPNNRNMDRGDCAYDRRQNLNISTTYTTPSYSNKFVRLLGSGWTGSLIWRYLTGAPITATTTDQALNGDTGTERPNQVLQNVYGTGFLTGFLNPAAFAQVPVGTFGNMGVFTIRGPGVPEIDAALYRTFKYRERYSLQFRGEAFNLPNDFLRGNPSASITSPTLGTINSAGNPRIMQFSMKFLF